MRSLCEPPILRILDDGVGPGWQDAERFYIKFFREEVGARLTNLTDGGDSTEGYVWTLEVGQKISRALTGRKHSPESLCKMRGLKRSPEVRQKMKESHVGMKGKKHSQETKNKMSLAHSNYTPELILRMVENQMLRKDMRRLGLL